MAREQITTDPWVRTGEPLFWLSGAGHEYIAPQNRYYYDSRRRADPPHWVLQLTLAGAGFFEKNRRRHLMEPGAAFLHRIPGDFLYGYPPERSDVYEQVFVSMTGPVATRWCERITAAHGHVLRFEPGIAATLAGMMLNLARERAGMRGAAVQPDRYLVSAQLNLLLMTILSALSQSRLAVRPLVTRAMAEIHERAGDPAFDVAAMAESAGCSREHLARAFRGALGVSPSDYLVQHRLRLAARLLRAGEDKIETVARQCGFAGANYFCRAFRRRVGVTPGQFRIRVWLRGP